jgi:hypothetical protein
MSGALRRKDRDIMRKYINVRLIPESCRAFLNTGTRLIMKRREGIRIKPDNVVNQQLVYEYTETSHLYVITQREKSYLCV